jgi:predicted enzyme related to lactoylglutathione lyase
MDKVGDLRFVILDTRDSTRGVPFWSQILGLAPTVVEGPYTELGDDGPTVRVAIQQVDHWPDGHPGTHIDIAVPDLEAAISQVEALGGRLVTRQGTVERWAIMADPDGNTFCLVL